MNDDAPRCRACGTDISHLAKPTGRPRQYCEHADCKRERNRAYVRKHRGTQRVLVRFTSDRNADGEPREHSIVDLKLWLEHQPDDEASQWLDERATFWIENGEEGDVSACAWCGEPATERLVEPYGRLGSGTVIKTSATGRRYDVCHRCAERLSRRYGLKREAT